MSNQRDFIMRVVCVSVTINTVPIDLEMFLNGMYLDNSNIMFVVKNRLKNQEELLPPDNMK